jgi:hypothetical protein
MPKLALGDAPNDYRGDGPKQYPLIDEDTVLVATITNVTEDVKPFKDRETDQYVVKLAWTFQAEHDGQERRLWGETGVEFVEHPDCRTYAWAQEAFGQTLPKGFVLDTDDLISQQVRIVVGIRTYTKKGESTPRSTNYVKDVMRARSAMGEPVPAAAADSFGDDPF